MASLDGLASEVSAAPAPPARRRAERGRCEALQQDGGAERQATPAAAKSVAGRAYGIQVGAFQAAPQARAAMIKAMQRAPDQLRGTFASISAHRDRKRTLFKATLVGMSGTKRSHLPAAEKAAAGLPRHPSAADEVASR